MNNYNTAQRINSQVNASVTYKTDLAQFKVPEFWTVAGKFGDCEDYAYTLVQASGEFIDAVWNV